MDVRCITLGTRPYIPLAKIVDVVGVKASDFLKWGFDDSSPALILVRHHGVRIEASSATMIIEMWCTDEQRKKWHAWVHEHKARRKLTEFEKKVVAARQMWKCALCKAVLSADYEVDHVEQQCIRNNNNTENLQALCPNCHRRKTREDRLFADPLINSQDNANAFSQYFN